MGERPDKLLTTTTKFLIIPMAPRGLTRKYLVDVAQLAEFYFKCSLLLNIGVCPGYTDVMQ